jgi:multimeric flavodoxin WrbA
MIVLGIYGSPRKGGNTDQLLDKVLEGARSSGALIKKVYARDIKACGCLECGGCDKTGACVVKDGMQDIYPLMEEADAVVLASPVFFYGLTAQVKVVVDRSQALWSKRLLRKGGAGGNDSRKRRGYLIAAGATKGKNLFSGVELEARYFFDALDMSYEGALLYRGLEGRSDIIARPEALDEAFRLGEKIAKEQP